MAARAKEKKNLKRHLLLGQLHNFKIILKRYFLMALYQIAKLLWNYFIEMLLWSPSTKIAQTLHLILLNVSVLQYGLGERSRAIMALLLNIPLSVSYKNETNKIYRENFETRWKTNRPTNMVSACYEIWRNEMKQRNRYYSNLSILPITSTRILHDG